MALQGDRSDITLPVTGGAAGAVAAYVILVADPAIAGNAKLSGAAGVGFVGVTKELTDTLGYAAVRTAGIARVRVGATTVTAGDQVASDASGLATTQAVAASGAAVKQIVGVALNTATTGTLVDVLLQPKFTVG